MSRWIPAICAGMLLTATMAYAQGPDSSTEIEALQKTVQEQNRMIMQLLQRIETLESRQEEQGDWIEDKQEEKPLWTEHVKVKGDFRYRYERIDDDRAEDDRNRNRIRARIGIDAMVNDSVDLAMQISTGGAEGFDTEEGDPLSSNTTLTNAFSSKHIWLSQAYADWHPQNVPGLHILGGKIKRPFYTVGDNKLIWDGDLNPEGGAIKYTKGCGSTEAFANLFGFWVLERKAGGDSGLFGVQTGLKHDFTVYDEKAHILGGASYYDFGNIKGMEPFFNADGDAFGNSLDPVGGLAEDFDLCELFGEFGFTLKGTPVLIFADYVTNTSASDEDDGWTVGFKIGKGQTPGSWQFGYLYEELEQDAVVGGFTDSDFAGGGANVEGHLLNLSYQLARNWQLTISYFHNKTNVSGPDKEEDYDKFQIDANFKF